MPKRIVKICQNCKRYWIVKKQTDTLCKQIINGETVGCEMKQLIDTDPGNYSRAENFDTTDFKSYFPFPLRLDEQMDIVWVGGSFNRAFDFALSFRGIEGINMTRKSKEKIVEILNLPEHKPTRDLDLKLSNDSILMNGKNFITIRGFGNLTSDNYSVGCFNLTLKEATEVQNKFQKFIWERLTTQEYKPQN